ncbi:MAG: hypothetical protein IT478_08755 [Xanthomonadales bacterium]|nr:hypothetical protein [Xanthomonadales bacterium]
MKLNTSADTSGFVGGDLGHLHGISAFGAVVRIARLNQFSRADQFAAFGFRSLQSEDPTKVLTFSAKRKFSLWSALGCDATVSCLWDIEPWTPFQGSDVWDKIPWRLRICPCCMRHGYHSLLFQMPWLARCPWHRTALIDACRRCKQPFMDASIGTRPLMQCACGADYFNERAALRGERPLAATRRQIMAEYLIWAKRQQAQTRLISPQEADAWGAEAIAALVDTTPWSGSLREVMPDKHGTTIAHHRTSLNQRTTAEDGSVDDDAGRCAASFTPGPGGMADLPSAFLAPLRHVTRGVLQGVPMSAFNCKENAAFFRPADAPASATATRRELLFLPVHECGSRVYLDLQILQRSALRSLCDFTAATLQPHGAETLASPRSQGLAIRVIRQLLARAYADGLTHVVGRHAPAVFDHRRIRSGPRMPWVAVVRDATGVAQVRAVWSPRRPWPDRL